jgi:hypothetical protein
MGTYCEPIRHAEWHKSAQDSWREAETPEDDLRWRLELIDWYVRAGLIGRRAQLFAEALACAQAVETPNPLEEKFRVQADKWERETAHHSSITKRVMHSSYQTIIGMGREVIPILLRDMQQNHRDWSWALYHLTQVNPINPEDAGRMDKIFRAWLTWGKKEGLL